MHNPSAPLRLNWPSIVGFNLVGCVIGFLVVIGCYSHDLPALALPAAFAAYLLLRLTWPHPFLKPEPPSGNPKREENQK